MSEFNDSTGEQLVNNNNDDDLNNSIIKKVKSRVSSILPLSKWFSPAKNDISTNNTNNNGISRKREFSEESSSSESSECESEFLEISKAKENNLPPTKKPRKVEETPSTSRQSRERSKQYNNEFVSSTPAAVSGSPYSTRPGASVNVSISNQNSNYRDIFPNILSRNAIQHRKCIRENFNRHQNILTDRSISEPPQRNSPDLFKKNRQIELDNDNDHHAIKQNALAMSIIEENENGTGNETSSETSSVALHHMNGVDMMQSNENRMSGFMGNRNKKFRASTGELCFSQHLETEKSLFSEKNLETSSVSSLRRQSFNPSLYGSSTSLTSNYSRTSHLGSPFYNGQTMYGGASAYSRRNTPLRSIRTPVQMRPSSRLSTASSSNNSLASDNPVALSTTAKRLLDVMCQFSSPINDARKLGNNLRDTTAAAAGRLPSLTQNRKRFDEDDLNSNRSIRLSSPITPYSRDDTSRNNNFKRELQVPTLTQLMKMKMQNNTEFVRNLAATSNSPLNKETEYKLPNLEKSSPQHNNASNTNNKSNNNSIKTHSNKIRNHITKTRNKDRETTEFAEIVNLPNVQLPELKSMPVINFNFDNKTQKTATLNNSENVKNHQSISSSPPSIFSSFNNSAATKATISEPIAATTQNSGFKFSSPIAVKSSDCNGQLSSNTFKFSDPFDPSKSITNFYPGKSAENFSTNKLVPVMPSTEKLTKPLLSGSVMDVLKSNKLPSEPIAEKPKAENNIGFGNVFKLATNQWECSICMIRNDNDKTKCVACETPKPGAKPAPTAAASTTSLNSAFKPATTDQGFKNLLAQQNSKWECSSCLTRNDTTSDKCACCSEPNPKSGKSTASANAIPAPAKSLWGAPSNDFKALVSQQQAKWECSACLTRNEQSKSKCVCCNQSNPQATKSVEEPQFSFGAKPTFSFGVPASSAASTLTSATEPKVPTFSFGVPSNNSSSNSKIESNQPKSDFIFGNKKPASTDTVDKPTFTFGAAAAVKKVEEKTTVEPAKSISTASSFGSNVPKLNTFGQSSAVDDLTKPKSISFAVAQNEEKKSVDSLPLATAPITATAAAVPAAVSESPKTFIFGQSKTIAPPTFGSAAVTKSSTFSFGGNEEPKKSLTFSFGESSTPAKSVASTDDDKKLANSTFIFGSAQKDKPNAISSVLTFGSNADTTKTTGGFQFGSSSLANSTNTTPNKTVTEVKPASTFSFGADKPAATPGLGSMIFGSASPASKPETAQPASNIFGSAESKLNATPTSSLLGLPSTNQIFPFGSSAKLGATTADTKPDAKSAQFIFGSSEQPSVLGGTTANFSFGAVANATAAPPSENNSFKLISDNISSNKISAPTFGAPAINFNRGNPSAEAKKFDFKPATSGGFNFGGAPATQTAPNTGNMGILDMPTANSSGGSEFGKSTFGSIPAVSNSISNPTSGFQFGSSSGLGNTNANNNQQQQQQQNTGIFSFGSENNAASSAPFNFTATSNPSFNFTSQAQQPATNAGAFQFGASNLSNNPFTAQRTGTQSQSVMAQRRKIKATRRIQPR